MRRLRAVFFDVGHSLLRAHPSVGEIYAAETRRLGADVAPEVLEEQFRIVFREFVPAYVADPAHRVASDEQDVTMWRGITRIIYDRVPDLHAVDYEKWFRTLYDKFSDGDVWRLYPDVAPALGRIRERGLRLGLVSNWDTRLRRIVKETGLADLVDFAVISAEVGVRKPEPGIFARALELAGVRAAEAAHVGDLFEEDVVGAHRSGLLPVHLDRTGRGAPSCDFSYWTVRTLEEFTSRVEERT
ncbi:MAG: HAD family hydrolase [Planctomycetota bacterium]|jgi:putative hydrolase of the HAD superfamily